jgi:putative SbcD/Mre11-related phosphoesterase
MCDEASLIPHGDWLLAPEGAAILPEEGVAVIADVHLGYEWARGTRGDMVPAHSLAETTARLTRLFDRVAVDRLVVAGDLVETARPCARTAADVRALRRWLGERGIELVALRGNHDPPGGPATIEIGGWTIGHGHRPLPPRCVFGHHHPVLRAGGLVAPCFLVGPLTIALPAFSANAAGLDVNGRALPDALSDPDLRCVAGLDGVLLDFGPRRRLRGGRVATRIGS